MEHQYPGAISGDGNFLAELMLPDQVHNRKEDWTIFFLHKEGDTGEGDAACVKDGDEVDDMNGAQNGVTNEDSEARPGTAETEGDAEGGQGPPLIYVLNLVNTKHDASVKRYV